jgi:hypothetical protein
MLDRMFALLALALLATAAHAAAAAPVLKHSDAAFMYAADEAAYKAYGATFVAWGGTEKAEDVRKLHDLGVRCTGSMWCLTAGPKLLHDDPKLHDAVAKDIEGNPIEVPWLFDHTYQGQKTWFGCTNHPAFREHCRSEVRRVMAGGADGLHVDDHLGVAQPATAFGGGLCDYCIAAFREYLRKNATPEELAKAGVSDLATFDFRDLIRKSATTRAEYLKVRRKIPLMDKFDRFHLEAAADFVRELGEVGAQAAGHPILLSANAWLVEERHRIVAKYLTHIVCEAEFHAEKGTGDLARVLPDFEQAQAFGKPCLVTAGGWDYAFVKANQAEDLVRFWIALTYAHGEWFMVPHPKRQWCFTKELGTHWYAAPVEAYAPMYQFIKNNAQWFDDFETADARGLKAPATVLVTARRKGTSGPVVLYLVNRDYDAAAKRLRPQKDVTIGSLPAGIGAGQQVQLLSYDAEPLKAVLGTEGGAMQLKVPELRVWTVAVIE